MKQSTLQHESRAGSLQKNVELVSQHFIDLVEPWLEVPWHVNNINTAFRVKG